MGCAGSKPMVASSYDAKPQPAQGNGHLPAAAGAKSDAEAPPPVTQPQLPEPEAPAPPTPPQAPPLPADTNGLDTPEEPKLRGDIAKMTTEKPEAAIDEEEEEDSVTMGDLPMLPKKQRSSIRRATPQVQSMSASMKRSSRDKVIASSRSSSIASEAISE